MQKVTLSGIEAEYLPRNEMTPLRHAWIDLFMPAHMAIQAKEIRLHLDWHLFSAEKISYLQGDEARKRFNQRRKATQLAWTSDARIGGFRLRWNDAIDPAAEIEQWGDLDGIWQDVVLTDESYQWVFAVTHERDGMGLGPYYATRPTQ